MFRILSIDGGGIKGAFPASFLAALEAALGERIENYFDLISGTSTGGIIAIALGLGIPISRITSLYETQGDEIFPSAQSWRKRASHYVSTKYSGDPLRKCLTDVFKDATLGDSHKRLVIPSFSALTGKIYVYKTPHDIRFESDWKTSAVDVAMATAAAPSYFPPYISADYISHLDGGMWANNPTGNAVVEAIGILNVPRHEIRVLSVSCTRTSQTFTIRNAGLWGWRKKALEAPFSGQSFGSMGTAAVLVGHDSIQRVDPTVESGRYELDDPRLVRELVGLGKECAREELPKFRRLFDVGKAKEFIPFHGARLPGTPVMTTQSV